MEGSWRDRDFTGVILAMGGKVLQRPSIISNHAALHYMTTYRQESAEARCRRRL